MTEVRYLSSAPGWRRIVTVPVGGLTAVGFSATERYLLVLSHDGRGVLESATGQRVARNRESPRHDSPWLKESARLIEGVPPVESEWIEAAGLWGGSLLARNTAGWSVRQESSGHGEVGYARHDSSTREFLVDSAITDLRAFGFSRSGRFLVFASTSELSLHEYS
jgi:hypothetical protein